MRHAGFVLVGGRSARMGRGRGPLAGLVTLLRLTPADWNVMVACDMPRLSSAFLRELPARAEELEAGPVCVAAQNASGQLQPLCAVYHRDCLPVAEAALARGQLRMLDLLASLRAIPVPCSGAFVLANINTPEEWREAIEPL